MTQPSLVGAYGLHWQRAEVEWNPGSGRSWQLLGRVGQKRPKLQVCDFRQARGVYLLHNDYTTTYVGIARGQMGLGARLQAHQLPPTKRPADMRHAPKDWTRFSWFSFDQVEREQPGAPESYLLSSDSFEKLTIDDSARELEALLIKVIGVRAQNQMQFAKADNWDQITLWDCEAGGALTKVSAGWVRDTELREHLQH